MNGATRLINGMFTAMLMAIFVSLGWQLWGRNWALGIPPTSTSVLPGESEEGALASLPRTHCCAPLARD